jgi:26S proteasome regulatory subunit N9
LKEALQFAEDVADKVNRATSQDTYAYALVEAAAIKLKLGQTDAVREDLDAASNILHTFVSIDPIIHAAFYRVTADFHRVPPRYPPKLTNRKRWIIQIPTAIHFSTSPVSLDKLLSEDEAHTRAYNLCIAALLSEHVYDFSELIIHPILNQLDTPEGRWLRELLFAMNSGDLDAFGKLVHQLPSNVTPFLRLLMGAFSCVQWKSFTRKNEYDAQYRSPGR